MFSTKNERSALLVSLVIFAIAGLMQLYRGFAQIPVTFNGHAVPTWPSLLVGVLLLAMAFWMGVLLKHRRPIL